MPYRMSRYRKPMPRRRRTGGRYVRRGRRGRGLFGDIWKGVKKFGSSANKFLKKTKAISTIAPLFGAKGKAIGAIAGRAGYGRHRRRMVKGRRRYRRGAGITVPGGGIRLAGFGKKKYCPRGMSY